jgi:toxin-antitoxin system PIN domain toxin
VIAVDTNIVIAAHRGEHPLHREADARLRAIAEDDAPWGLPVFCLGEFVRVTTHARIFTPPSSLPEALQAIGALLQSPTVRLLSPGEAYFEHLSRALHDGDARGNLAFDAQIVAVCREHGVDRLLTSDRDFARFKDISVELLA